MVGETVLFTVIVSDAGTDSHRHKHTDKQRCAQTHPKLHPETLPEIQTEIHRQTQTDTDTRKSWKLRRSHGLSPWQSTPVELTVNIPVPQKHQEIVDLAQFTPQERSEQIPAMPVPQIKEKIAKVIQPRSTCTPQERVEQTGRHDATGPRKLVEVQVVPRERIQSHVGANPCAAAAAHCESGYLRSHGNPVHAACGSELWNSSSTQL